MDDRRNEWITIPLSRSEKEYVKSHASGRPVAQAVREALVLAGLLPGEPPVAPKPDPKPAPPTRPARAAAGEGHERGGLVRTASGFYRCPKCEAAGNLEVLGSLRCGIEEDG